MFCTVESLLKCMLNHTKKFSSLFNNVRLVNKIVLILQNHASCSISIIGPQKLERK